MLQKLNTRRGGFTLVEIMIVVAIIALLAAFAAPSLIRARKRTQAGACKADLRAIADGVDQWALEQNKSSGTPAWSDLKPFMKETSRLGMLAVGATPTDTIGGTIVIPAVGSAIAVPATTFATLSDVAPADFWSPYTTN